MWYWFNLSILPFFVCMLFLSFCFTVRVLQHFTNRLIFGFFPYAKVGLFSRVELANTTY